MDSLTDKWRSLSILEEEGDIISITPELAEKGRQLVPIGLVGKLLSKRFINKNSFCKSLKQIWNINSNMKFRVIAENTFLFTFEDEEIIERILASEPWSYNRSLLLLKKFEGFPQGDAGPFQTFQIWVRAYNIPVEAMFSDIAMLIGDDIGVAIKVDTDKEGRCLGTYMRIRVLLDVTKPLRRVARISLEPSSPILVVGLRYERLPDFCYSCGILGHVATECIKHPFQKDIAYMDYPFGPWLRFDVDITTEIKITLDVPRNLIVEAKEINNTAMHLDHKNYPNISNIGGKKRSIQSHVPGSPNSPTTLNEINNPGEPAIKKRSVSPVSDVSCSESST